MMQTNEITAPITHLSAGKLSYRVQIPSTVTQLTFACTTHYYNWLVVPNLTQLIFEDDSEFDDSVDNLPKSLTHLRFGKKFSRRSVDHLPDSLTHLEFGEAFNQPVDNLPAGLISVKFGKKFAQSIDSLPHGLKSLKLCNKYRQLITSLPSSLQHFEFAQHDRRFELWEGVYRNEILEVAEFPSSLESLTGDCFSKENLKIFPPGLKHLHLLNYFNYPLPQLPSLQTLKLSTLFNQSLEGLPPALQVLSFENNDIFSQPLVTFPVGLRILNLGNSTVKFTSLPPNLTELYGSFYTPDCTLPPTLTHLQINAADCPVLEDAKFPALISLSLDGGEKLENCKFLPSSSLLTQFTIGDMMYSYIHYFPPNITTLTVGCTYDHPLLNIPDSISSLIIRTETQTNRVWKQTPNLRKFKLELLFLDISYEEQHFPNNKVRISSVLVHEK